MKYEKSRARNWARENLRGHLVTTTTPLHDDLSLDIEGLQSNVDYLMELPCVEGLYVNSVIQEAPALTLDERDLVMRTVIDRAAGRMPTIAVAHGTATADVIAAANRAEEAGADLVILWPPTFGHRTQEGVSNFIREVADNINIGFCLYSSGLSEFGFRITTDMVRDLLDIPHLCAVKEASLSLSGYLGMLSELGDDLIISCPLDEYWAAGRVMMPDKAADVLLGSSRPLFMETPDVPLLSDLRRSVNSGGDIAAPLKAVVDVATELHTKFLEAGSHNIAIMKAVTGELGLAAGPVRPPMSQADPEVIEAGRRALQKFGLLPTAG